MDTDTITRRIIWLNDRDLLNLLKITSHDQTNLPIATRSRLRCTDDIGE